MKAADALDREGDRLLAQAFGSRTWARGLCQGGLGSRTWENAERRFSRHGRFLSPSSEPVAPPRAESLVLSEIVGALIAAGLTERQRSVALRRVAGASLAEIAAQDGVTRQGARVVAERGAAKARRAARESRWLGLADAYRADVSRGRARRAA